MWGGGWDTSGSCDDGDADGYADVRIQTHPHP